MEERFAEFHNCFDRNPIPFAIIELVKDAAGNSIDFAFSYLNETAAAALDCRPENLQNRHFYEIVDAADTKWLKLLDDVAFRGISKSVVEFSPELQKYLSLTLYQLEKGVCGCTFQDATDHIEAQTKLQETDTKLQGLLKNMPGALIIAKITNTITPVFISQDAGRILRRSQEDLRKTYSQNMLAYIHPDDQEMVQGLLDETIARKGSERVTCRMRRGDGEFIWVATNFSVVEFSDGSNLLYMVSTDVTLETEAKIMLAMSEERLRTAVSLTGVTVWEYDPATDKVVISAQGDHHGNFPQKIDNALEFIKRIHYFHPSCEARALAVFDRIKAGEKDIEEDFMVCGGTENYDRWERVHYSTIFDKNGNPIKAIAVAKDITKDKQIEERYQSALAYNKLLLPSALLSAQINITRNTLESFTASLPGLSESQHFCSLEDVVCAMAPLILNTPGRNTFVENFSQQNIIKSFEGGIPLDDIECLMDMGEGRHEWISMSMRLCRHPLNGDIIGFFCALNIHEKKVLRLITSQAITRDYDFLAYINNATDQFMMFTEQAEDCALHCSERCGFTEYLQNNINPYLLPTHGEVEPLTSELVFSGVAEQEELVRYALLPMPNGEARHKKLRFQRVEDSSHLLVLSCIDVDDIVRQEILQNQRLDLAFTAAEQASQAKSAFLSRMSHETRTPLNAILGLTGLAMQTGELSDLALETYRKIDHSARYLLDLIDDILDMSRIESGKSVLEQEKIDLPAFFAGLSITMTPRAQKENLRYEQELKNLSEEPYYGDSTKLGQALGNLLDNAIKFTPQGGKIHVKAEQLEATQDYATIRIIISDTGIGISDEFLAHAFEPFSQEDCTESLYTGTGLGLAITKNLVNLLGGTIRLESTKGFGTKVTLDIPLALKADPANFTSYSDPYTTLGQDGSDDFDFSGKHVLLAEDHPLNIEVATKLLESRGIQVDVVTNGLAAVEKFASNPKAYDAILLDIRMPVMDGLLAADTIRKLKTPESKLIPIVAMTANAFDEDTRKSREHGMNAHLTKPISRQQLFATLYHVMTQPL